MAPCTVFTASAVRAVLKLQPVMALMLLVMTESLRPWDGALRGALLFGLSGRRGEPLFS